MSNFNNSDYEFLLNDCLNDAFYSETSFRGKISHIRQFAEIIVRKLIDFPSNEQLTLGNSKVKVEIQKLKEYDHILDCVEKVREDDGNMHRGNSCTHTKVIDEITEEEYREAIDCLQELIACLFINFFSEYTFGNNSTITRNFSLLPPIIRYKTLSYLYKNDNSNAIIIDKLVLSHIKTYGADSAKTWVENNKEHLSKIPTISPEEAAKLASMGVLQFLSKTMYDCCIGKIADSNSYPKMYKTFEEAKSFYLKNNTLSSTDEETLRFKDLMDFVYIGRKEDPLPIDNNPYYVLHCLK